MELDIRLGAIFGIDLISVGMKFILFALARISDVLLILKCI